VEQDGKTVLDDSIGPRMLLASNDMALAGEPFLDAIYVSHDVGRDGSAWAGQESARHTGLDIPHSFGKSDEVWKIGVAYHQVKVVQSWWERRRGERSALRHRRVAQSRAAETGRSHDEVLQESVADLDR
jgi:hypothetical protein